MRRSLLEQARAVLELPEAPVFRPTAAEFGDPLAYIGKIQSRGVLSGIAKIIPPQGMTIIQKRPEALFNSKASPLHIASHKSRIKRLCCLYSGWKLDFNLDIKEHFVTKRQHVHTLQEGFPFGEVSPTQNSIPRLSALILLSATNTSRTSPEYYNLIF